MGGLRHWAMVALVLFIFLEAQGQALSLRTVCSLPPVISETSGLICTGPNRLWSHNDNGGEPRLYQFDTTGALLRSVVVRNTSNIDWEEVTQDNAGNVYVGDFGNNGNNRQDLVILKLPPLDGLVGDTVDALRIEYSYPDQAGFPPPDSLKYFDMEAMVAWGDSLYLFSKNRTVPFDGLTKRYSLPQAPGSYVAELQDSFYTGPGTMLNNWIAGAALRQDGQQLVLNSYSKVWIYSCFDGTDYFGGASVQWNLPFSQLEAMAWRDSHVLYLTDEVQGNTGGKLYALDLSQFGQAPMATLGADTTYLGDTLWLSAPQQAGASYLWSTGATSSTIPVVQSGDYWLQVTAANGCTNRDSISVTVLVGIGAVPEPKFQLWPQPSAGVVQVALPQGAATGASWELFGMDGSVLLSGSLQGIQGSLDFSNVPAGTYLLQMKASHQVWRRVILLR